MRGKLVPRRRRQSCARNIPAYAGKTPIHQPRLPAAQEHPRVCGENWNGGVQLPIAWGTSPRMRGKQVNRAGCGRVGGNIPAYAGKTIGAGRRSDATWEHPRVCGENDTFKAVFEKLDGTSPRMRGKPTITADAFAGLRNIPAYAGKTSKMI